LKNLSAGLFEPLLLDIPVLRLDTNDGYSPPADAIHRFVVHHAGRGIEQID
jgi:hypothetical protein